MQVHIIKLKDKKSKAASKEVKNFNSAYFSPNPTGGMPYGVSQNMVSLNFGPYRFYFGLPRCKINEAEKLYRICEMMDGHVIQCFKL